MKKDVEISREHGIPVNTLADWKKTDKENWRYGLYHHLKESDCIYFGELEEKLDKTLKPLDDLIRFHKDSSETVAALYEARNIIMLSTLRK